MCLKLGNMIDRLAYPAYRDSEEPCGDKLKRRVCDAIFKYIAEINGVREYERKTNNHGAYMRDWTATVESWIKKVV